MARLPGRDPRAQLPAGETVTVEIPYAVVLLAAVEAACIAVGAVIGVGVVLCRMVGERRGD